jgi:hypothetical protein
MTELFFKEMKLIMFAFRKKSLYKYASNDAVWSAFRITRVKRYKQKHQVRLVFFIMENLIKKKTQKMFRENKSLFKRLDVFSIIFDFLEIVFLKTEKYSTSKHDINVSSHPSFLRNIRNN